MKITSFILLMFLLSGSILLAQSSADELRNFVRNKDYMEASALIPKAVKENPKDAGLMILCGDIYFELEKIDSALIMYLKADDIRGDLPATLRKIAKAYSYLGKHDLAVKAMKDAIKEDPKDVYNLLALGDVYLRADSMKQAELTITKAREMNKKIPDGYVALGDLYFAQKVYELARSNYEDALSLDPNLLDARIKLATSYYMLGLMESSEDLSNELLTRSLKEWTIITKQDPKNARAFYEQAKLLFLSRHFSDAIKPFYEYLNLRPTGSLARWYLAQCLYEDGFCDSAATQLKIVASEIDSVRDKSSLMLARCYYKKTMFTDAVKIFEQLEKNKVKIELQDMEIYASALFKQNDTLSSIRIYKQIIDEDTTKCDLIYKIAQLLRLMKNYDSAIEFYIKRLKYCKDELEPKLYFYIGTCYFSKEKPDSALIFLQKSLEMDSSDLYSRIYIADAYAALDRKVESKQEFNLVIEKGFADTSEIIRKLMPSAFAKLSDVLFKDKDYKGLQSSAKKWIEYDPKSSLAYLYLAVSYQGLGDTENACKYYKKVVQLDPQNKSAIDMLKKLNCP